MAFTDTKDDSNCGLQTTAQKDHKGRFFFFGQLCDL